jgi:3',5'-cyclic AMP phosphodiesterase CpdA
MREPLAAAAVSRFRPSSRSYSLDMHRWTVVCVLVAAASARAAEYTYVQAGDPGRRACGSPPAGWQRAEFDDRAWEVPQPVAGPPSNDGGAEGPVSGGVACAATVFARWRFDTGPETARLATLMLRLRYEHGFAAYLNGVEIARRRLEPNAEPAALSTDLHGPEPERVFVPMRPGLLRPSGNVLAIEVHPRTAGHAPLVEAELAGADGPRIIRGPYLQRLAEREVTVVFDTDLPTLAEVRWGTSEEYGAINTDAPPQMHHALRLRNLAAGTAYHYRVSARTGAAPIASSAATVPFAPGESVDGGDAVFHTPPPPGRPLRFIVYGDVRSGHDIHAQLARAIADEDPDLAVLTGDLVDRGTDEGDWERFFEIAAPLLRQVAIFPAPGNHEYARLGRGVTNFLQLFRWPLRPGEEESSYYSFDAAGVHFVALDSNQYGSPRQREWLERDLTAAEKRGARALFAYAHEGPFSSGMHGDNATCIHDYVPIFERHHLTMFFGGHDHDYERGRVGRLDYLVSGGGGAELRAQRCGLPGKRACPPRVAELVNDHHYVVVEVLPSLVRVCPKRPDGMPLVACSTFPLRK